MYIYISSMLSPDPVCTSDCCLYFFKLRSVYKSTAYINKKYIPGEIVYWYLNDYDHEYMHHATLCACIQLLLLLEI